MATVQVRYIVNDVDAAIAFYCEHLGFHEDMHPAPAFAMLSRGDLRLVLSAPNASRPSSIWVKRTTVWFESSGARPRSRCGGWQCAVRFPFQ